MQEKEKSKLFCIDWQSSGADLFGAESTGKYGLVEIVVMPCNVKLDIALLGGLTDRISDDCIWDLD